jgi:hypothetical protein
VKLNTFITQTTKSVCQLQTISTSHDLNKTVMDGTTYEQALPEEYFRSQVTGTYSVVGLRDYELREAKGCMGLATAKRQT